MCSVFRTKVHAVEDSYCRAGEMAIMAPPRATEIACPQETEMKWIHSTGMVCVVKLCHAHTGMFVMEHDSIEEQERPPGLEQ